MKYSVLLLLVFFTTASFAQTHFFPTIKVEFEKTTYVRQLVKEQDAEWYERSKDRLPEKWINYFDFIGDTTQSLFKPGREVAIDQRAWYRPVADKNVVYSNFKTGQTVSQKPVFEETFLVEDSMAKIQWKITSDTRTIAGFDCRKAFGIINDSIGV